MTLSKTTLNYCERRDIRVFEQPLDNGEPGLIIYATDSEHCVSADLEYFVTDQGFLLCHKFCDIEDLPYWIKTEKDFRLLVDYLANH